MPPDSLFTFDYTDIWQISVMLVIIESISDYKFIRNFKSVISNIYFYFAAFRLAKQCTDP